MRLSGYYTLARLAHSDTALALGLDNAPPPEALANLRRVARGLDRVRRLLGHPLEISSGYRAPAVNVAVGGVAHSQHTRGEAVDFVCPGYGPPAEVARAIRDSDIAFDQCILEFGRWVHLSFSAAPRRRTLTLYSAADGYLDGLVAPDGAPIA
jgi:hypothetical protein